MRYKEVSEEMVNNVRKECRVCGLPSFGTLCRFCYTQNQAHRIGVSAMRRRLRKKEEKLRGDAVSVRTVGNFKENGKNNTYLAKHG